MNWPDYLTSTQVADRLNLTSSRVLRLAKSRGLGQRIGRDWLFTESDIAAMQTRVPGRPCPAKEQKTVTVSDLEFNGYTAVLVRYPSAYGPGPGEHALWITDEYLAGKSDTPGTYTLNDINTSTPFGADEDIDAAIRDWKLAVEWGEAND